MAWLEKGLPTSFEQQPIWLPTTFWIRFRMSRNTKPAPCASAKLCSALDYKMKLSLSLQEHLERSAMLHSRLCPRQVLGVRMARVACTLLNIDPAVDRKRIAVYMEIGRCAADAVMVVTGASPTNGLMQLLAYSKVAASFI